MTQAELQARLDEAERRGGGEIVGDGELDLEKPLVIRSHTHVRWNGWWMARHRGPCLETPTTDDAQRWSLRGPRMRGGGIRLPATTGQVDHFAIEDVQVVEADVAFDDQASGAWMSTLARVWAADCAIGFRRRGGTTLTMTACYANVLGKTGTVAYDFTGCYSTTLIGCAMDGHDSDAPVAIFSACRGLNLFNFHGEGNKVTNAALISLRSCQGLSMQGLWTIGTRIVTQPQGGAYLLDVAYSRGLLSGLNIGGHHYPDDPDRAEGRGGVVCTVVAHGGDDLGVTFEGCDIGLLRGGERVTSFPMAVIGGGSPSVRVGKSCRIDGPIAGDRGRMVER